MEIKRVQNGRNDFNWEGLTIGKLLLIYRALLAFNTHYQDAFSRDLLEFLRSKKIVEVEPFTGKKGFL